MEGWGTAFGTCDAQGLKFNRWEIKTEAVPAAGHAGLCTKQHGLENPDGTPCANCVGAWSETECSPCAGGNLMKQ